MTIEPSPKRKRRQSDRELERQVQELADLCEAQVKKIHSLRLRIARLEQRLEELRANNTTPIGARR